MTIKVLVVDDSALMRRQLKKILESAGDFEIELARDGQEAIDLNLSYKPDVISLDINMPVIDGLTALAYIMASRPVPVVMVSSLTQDGAMATFESLALGAVDYIGKPGGTISLTIDEIAEELVEKLRSAAKAKIRDKQKGKSAEERLEEVKEAEKPKPKFVRRGLHAQEVTTIPGLVIIGVSTGGPSCLEEILPLLPEDFPLPIVVAQHMPGSFTASFANRLNNICKLQVVEANKLLSLTSGTIYIAKGGADVAITNRGGVIMVQPKPEHPKFLWHPSAELLGQSVLEHYDPPKVIAVLLTGMGYDGADSFAEIKKQGGKTIAESEETATVFGMPQELIARRGATVVLPSYKIAGQLTTWAQELIKESN
jgi:two-component system chemotaxis response regulator CheB